MWQRLWPVVLVAACGSGKARPPPDARLAVDARAPDAAPASVDASASNTIKLSIEPPRDRTPGLAVRCSIAGDPLGSDCSLRGSVAVDGDGRVYVVEPAGVRRFRQVAQDGCALELDTTITIPEMKAAGQPIDKGPVYMRSGGPSWSVVAGPRGAVYAFDYLLGIHRIDRGEVEPVCPTLQGVGSLVFAGSKAYVRRSAVEALALGKQCKVTKTKLEPMPRFGLFAIGDTLVGELDDNQLVVHGDPQVELGDDDHFAPGGLCSITGVVACGDDVCVVDHNCKKLPRFARDGALVGSFPFRALFTDDPYAVAAAANGPDGTIWLAAVHKDGTVCEGAVYRVDPGRLDPAALTTP